MRILVDLGVAALLLSVVGCSDPTEVVSVVEPEDTSITFAELLELAQEPDPLEGLEPIVLSDAVYTTDNPEPPPEVKVPLTDDQQRLKDYQDLYGVNVGYITNICVPNKLRIIDWLGVDFTYKSGGYRTQEEIYVYPNQEFTFKSADDLCVTTGTQY